MQQSSRAHGLSHRSSSSSPRLESSKRRWHRRLWAGARAQAIEQALLGIHAARALLLGPRGLPCASGRASGAVGGRMGQVTSCVVHAAARRARRPPRCPGGRSGGCGQRGGWGRAKETASLGKRRPRQGRRAGGGGDRGARGGGASGAQGASGCGGGGGAATARRAASAARRARTTRGGGGRARRGSGGHSGPQRGGLCRVLGPHARHEHNAPLGRGRNLSPGPAPTLVITFAITFALALAAPRPLRPRCAQPRLDAPVSGRLGRHAVCCELQPQRMQPASRLMLPEVTVALTQVARPKRR